MNEALIVVASLVGAALVFFVLLAIRLGFMVLFRIFLFAITMGLINYGLIKLMAQYNIELPLAVWAGIAMLPGFLSSSFLFTLTMLFPISNLFILDSFLALAIMLPQEHNTWRWVALAAFVFMVFNQVRVMFVGRKLTAQDIEQYIVWTKVGPEELTIVEKLRAANQDFQIKALVRQLIQREAMLQPDEMNRYTLGDFLDDWRVYAGALLEAGIGVCLFIAGYLTVVYFRLLTETIAPNVEDTVLYAFLPVALCVGIGVAYYGSQLVKTHSWLSLILSWLAFNVATTVFIFTAAVAMIPLLWPLIMEGIQQAQQASLG